MAIILIDKNDATAIPLQEMLSNCLSFPVARAHNQDSAFQSMVRSPPLAILCRNQEPDIDCATFSQLLSQRWDWNHIALLAVTDRFIPFFTPLKWKRQSPRVDQLIGTPVYGAALFAGLAAAARIRSEANKNLIFFGNQPTLFAQLKGSPLKGWDLISYAEYEASEQRSMGAAIVDLDSLTQKEVRRIVYYLKTLNHRPLVFCVGGDARGGLLMRQFCQTFADTPKTQKEWAALIDELDVCHRNRWELRALELHWNISNRERDLERMGAVSSKMKQLSAHSARTQMILGEFHIANGESHLSKPHFQNVIAKNKYHVKAYRRLFQHFSHNQNGDEVETSSREPSIGSRWMYSAASHSCPIAALR